MCDRFYRSLRFWRLLSIVAGVVSKGNGLAEGNMYVEVILLSFCQRMPDDCFSWLRCAGRMQDNEPLMRALSSLINLNHPDLVLFVGEALVRLLALCHALKCQLAETALAWQKHIHAVVSWGPSIQPI